MPERLPEIRPLLVTAQQLVRQLYVQILLFFLFFQAIDLLLLIPLTSLLLNKFLAFTGNHAIGNFDIAAYLLTPVGILFVVLTLTLFVVTFMLKLSGLLLLCHAGVNAQDESTLLLFKKLGRRMPTILRLAMRTVLLLACVLLPLLLPVIFFQQRLLSAHDINYYLANQPPEYWLLIAVAALAGLSALLLCVGIVIFLAFALPQILFANQSALEAYQDSKKRFKPVSLRIVRISVKSLALWLLLVLSVNLIIYLTGTILIKMAGSSMPLLLPAAGVTLGLNLVSNTLLGFLGLSSIAFVVYQIWYQVKYDRPICLAHRQPARLPELKIMLPVSLLLIAAALSAGILMLNQMPLEDKVTIIAHRGSSRTAPENSLSAIRQSSIDGADMAEIDVQLSRDGKVVIWHDNDAMRLSGKPGHC